MKHGRGILLAIALISGMIFPAVDLVATTTETGSIAAAVSDADLRIAVEARLMADPAVSAHGIDVAVSKGIVTLGGTVDNLLSKDRAVTVCESIKGVASVIDRVKTITRPVPDRELRKRVAFAMAASPVSSAHPPTVSIDARKVTLP